MKRLIKKTLLYPYLKQSRLVRRLRLGLRNRKIKATLVSQLSGPAENEYGTQFTGKKVLIPMIETSYYQQFQVLLVAKALEMRGAKVKVLLCGSVLRGCELRSVRNKSPDPCMDCRVNSRQLVNLFGLDVVNLRDYLSEDELKRLDSIAREIVEDYPKSFSYRGIEVIHMTNDSVTRYYYGGVPESNSPELKETRFRHLASALLSIECAYKIEDTWNPDIVFNNMNAYTEWMPYHALQIKLGKRSCTISVTPFNFHSVILDVLDLYETDRFRRWLGLRKDPKLTVAEREHLVGMLDSRMKGNAPVFQHYNCFENSNLDRHLKIDKNKKNLFLFSNVFWDVGISDSATIYKDVIEWVLDTIKFVAEKPDVHLYIKTHPAEVFDTSTSLKGVRDFIFQQFPVLPSNVTIIHPEWKIMTYDLFPFVDVGLVYNGTLGLEMMLSNIPVIITGKAPFSNIGIGNEPKSFEEYRKMLTGELSLVMPDVSRAELFAYFYFIKTCIPWTFTSSAYANAGFNGFTFKTIDEIGPGKNKIMDHICDCILDPKKHSPEMWEESMIQPNSTMSVR